MKTIRLTMAQALVRYVDALGRSSMRDAIRLVADLAGSGVPLDRIVGAVLAPAQVEVGRMWELGRWSVAQDHTATGITEVALQTAVLSAGVRVPASPASSASQAPSGKASAA